jgi:hypothetical protein
MVAYISGMATIGFFFHGHQAASPKGNNISIFDLEIEQGEVDAPPSRGK